MIDRDTTAIEAQLAALNPTMVGALVNQALGGQGWNAPDWCYNRVSRSMGSATGGVYRLAGSADRSGEQNPWSIILKVVVPLAGMTPEQNADSTHPTYWKREVLAYQSGWLAQLPGGIRGPRCFGVQAQPDGAVWLWLEDVRDRYGEQWPLEQYARAARCLGRFNGTYLAGQPWPPYAWLSDNGVQPRGVITAFGWVEKMVRDPATWEHPLLKAIFPPVVVAGLPRLWDNRNRLLDALETRAPQTVCHQDAWRGNMMALAGESDAELALIDWAYVARSVLGADLADLAVAGYGMVETRFSLVDIDRAVFDSYLEGLREAGWPAERNLVRFAYTTFAALKYGCLTIWLRNVLDEGGHAFWERISGQPMEQYLSREATMLEHLLHLLDEALGLLGVL